MTPLSVNEISKALTYLPGCMGAFFEAKKPCEKDTCLQCRVRGALLGKAPAEHAVSITSLLSARDEAGKVEIVVNSERIHMSVAKAREIYNMLGAAIEGAVTDEIVFKTLQRAHVAPPAIGRFLSDLREARQGSRGTVYPS